MNVSEYLLTRLNALGVEHAFGVPGDFILPFFEAIGNSPVTRIAACNELDAGYAADGYARLKGLGLAVVTYGPGSFSLVNAVAGAHAEDVPLVVVSGGPPSSAYRATSKPVLHHLLTDNYEASMRIFEQVTAYARLVDNPEQAAANIDEALHVCLSRKKPVYLEIPSDIQLHEIGTPGPFDIDLSRKNNGVTEKAARLLIERITSSERTIILPGHEIHRWALQDKVTRLARKTGIPVASMFVGKAEYMEYLPECIGVYQGAGSIEAVRKYVESADTVLFLGAVPSDLNLGGFTAKLTSQQIVTVWNNKIQMEQGCFSGIPITNIVELLLERLPGQTMQDEDRPVQCFLHKANQSHNVETDAVLTNKRFYDRLANFFQPNDIVLADGGCAFNLTHMQFPANTSFVASNYWASIGMGFGAALGACFAAADKQRIIAVEGDGSFQMTALELSSMIRYGKAPIVFVVNNKGYTAERFIHDGEFNDIPQWRYHKLPEAFGGGTGIEVRTEGELELALEKASDEQRSELLLIEVHLGPFDVSEGFRALCEAFRSH